MNSEIPKPADYKKRDPHKKIHARHQLYMICPIGSQQFNRFIDFMRSLSSNEMAESMWVCVNCWELLLGPDCKMEHVNARHLLTSNLADSDKATLDNYSKLCRVYGKINPEETHVVLLYVPEYVREAVRAGKAS